MMFWFQTNVDTESKVHIKLHGFLGGSSQACLYDLQIRFSGKELPEQYPTDTESKVRIDVAWIGSSHTCLYDLQIEFSGKELPDPYQTDT